MTNTPPLSTRQYRDYTIQDVFERTASELRAEIVAFWGRNHAIGAGHGDDQRAAQTALTIRTADGRLVGLSTVYEGDFQQPGNRYYFYRMFIQESDRVPGLMRRVTQITHDILAARHAPGKPSGMMIVTENQKLMRPGLRRMFERYGCRYLGRGPQGNDLWLSEFAQPGKAADTMDNRPNPPGGSLYGASSSLPRNPGATAAPTPMRNDYSDNNFQDNAVVGVPVAQMPQSRNSPCPCGSGLKHRHCCGLQQLRPPSREQADNVEDDFLAAESAQQQGDNEQARRHCVAVLSQTPGHSRALQLLAQLLKQAGENQAVEALLRRIVQLLPQQDAAHAELALWLYQQHNLTEAEKSARNVVRLSPDNAQGHNLMGMILTEAHRLPTAEFHYRRALELHGPVGKLCANLALNLKQQGKLEQAEDYYRQAMELEPDNMSSLMGWLKLKEVGRQFGDAETMLETLQQRLPPDHISVCMSRSTLCRRNKDLAGALAALDAVAPAQYKNHPGYFYERGEVLDKLDRFDEAFAAFDEANRLVREQGKRNYPAAAAENQVQRRKAFFTRERMQKLPRGHADKHETTTPIFIIGFPRSGTTMVEQILTTHAAVSAGDELNFMWELVAAAPRMLNSNLGYPECLADLWFGDNQAALSSFRDFYLRKAHHYGIIDESARLFTDKMPLNETNLGLIHLVFPEAPVVHLIRHPLDVVLSCYFNDLTHGHNMAYGLESAARHYALIRGLLDEHLQAMDIRYLPLRYEDIVDDAEPNCRKLFDFIGLDWDPRCLDFHQNPRYARTASYAQVTEKLYSRSRFRYLNYLPQLEPVLPILAPVIERLGYQIEQP